MTTTDDALALDAILGDFEVEQRRMLRMAVDKAIDQALLTQGKMLQNVKALVGERQRAAIATMRDEIQRAQPSMIEMVIATTLDSAPTSGLVHWILDDLKQQDARACVERLRGHLEARQGNFFRSDFEALLVVYMEYLGIAMPRGSRLGNRIDDLKDALQRQATSTDDLTSLVYRVNWACYGVRTIGNARSHDTTPLSDAEILELCGCFSALGAAMPTLALEFKTEPVAPDVPDQSDAPAPSTVADLVVTDAGSALISQLLAGSSNGNGAELGERILQLLAAGLTNGTNGASAAMTTIPTATTTTIPSNGGYSLTTGQAPPLPPGFPLVQPPLPPGFASVVTTTSTTNAPRGASTSPLRQGSPTAVPVSSPVSKAIVPTQAALAAVPSFKYYYERPTDLPRETDRTRMAMFARMINHMKVVDKAKLCPFPAGHEATCPLSHSYLEVMRYNPLFKRLVCRQAAHYWSNQVAEDENCVCIHVDTGLKWEWLDESRDKRSYCSRGDKCTNTKCIKSHSFEELCWYNPAFKVKKCAIRAHDHIARGRGTIAPPLECNYYHIEVGPNADMRQLMVEDDHVGKNVPMLFIERTHKPLADALEALRYAREHNL